MNNKQALIALGTIAAMLVILIGGVKLGSVVFASGNHSPSTSNTGTSSTNPFGSGQSPRFGNGRPGFGSFLANAAIGQVTAVHGNTITVAGFRGGSNTTVTVTAGTKFQKGSFQSVSAAKLSDVKVGTFVMARGTKHGSSLTATSVRIRTGASPFRPGGNNPYSGGSAPNFGNPGSGFNPGSGTPPSQ
jgi:hypothetical protein